MAAEAMSKQKNDPFLGYGIGVQNYFNLQEKLLWIFFFLTIGACFQMGIFNSFGGLDGLKEYVTTTADLSFGNIGFAGNYCAKMPIDWEHEANVKLQVKCQHTTTISGVLSSGMMLDRAFPGGAVDAVHDCYLDKND